MQTADNSGRSNRPDRINTSLILDLSVLDGLSLAVEIGELSYGLPSILRVQGV